MSGPHCKSVPSVVLLGCLSASSSTTVKHSVSAKTSRCPHSSRPPARQAMVSDDHGCVQQVTATLTQLATGLPLSDESPACAVCDTPLRAGMPIIIQLTRTTSHPIWEVQMLYCRDCPSPFTNTVHSGRVLAGMLSVRQQAHTQTHTLCLTDVEPLANSSVRNP